MFGAYLNSGNHSSWFMDRFIAFKFIRFASCFHSILVSLQSIRFKYSSSLKCWKKLLSSTYKGLSRISSTFRCGLCSKVLSWKVVMPQWSRFRFSKCSRGLNRFSGRLVRLLLPKSSTFKFGAFWNTSGSMWLIWLERSMSLLRLGIGSMVDRRLIWLSDKFKIFVFFGSSLADGISVRWTWTQFTSPLMQVQFWGHGLFTSSFTRLGGTVLAFSLRFLFGLFCPADGELLGGWLLDCTLLGGALLDSKLLGDGLLDGELLDGELVDCKSADDWLVGETSCGWTDEDGPLDDWLVGASFPVASVAISLLATSAIFSTDTLWAMIKGKKTRIIRNENRILKNL